MKIILQTLDEDRKVYRISDPDGWEVEDFRSIYES